MMSLCLGKEFLCTETVQMLSKEACLDPVTEFGMDIMIPNRTAVNASRWTCAINFHPLCQHKRNIGGGLTATVPAYRDWQNPKRKPFMDNYLAAKDGIPTENRLRIMRLVKDITGHHWQPDTIYGEGSMAVQEMSPYASADWKRLQAASKRADHIDRWQDNPLYGKPPLKEYFVKMPAVDDSYKSLTSTAKK